MRDCNIDILDHIYLSTGLLLTKGGQQHYYGFKISETQDLNSDTTWLSLFEPPHGKTNNLHRRKQRPRSASQ